MTSPGKRKHHTPSCGMLISNRNCRVQERLLLLCFLIAGCCCCWCFCLSCLLLAGTLLMVVRGPCAVWQVKLQSHIDLHIRDVHRVCSPNLSPMEVLVAVHDHLARVRRA
jgi:hypothetical protein